MTDWGTLTLAAARREALSAASRRQTDRAEQISRLLEGKLSVAARAHMENLEAAAIYAAEELMKEVAQ